MNFDAVFNLIVWGAIFIFLIYKFIRAIRIVPNRKEYIVERLGKYNRTLGPGFHALVPFFDKVVYQQDLREEAINVPPQECFTKDNVRVEVDGVLYLSIRDSKNASYGVTDHQLAAWQLANTTTRSVIGTLELDETFEERNTINSRVVEELTNAGEDWGIHIHRFEIKNISPPKTVNESMEKQMGAEREKRAIVATAQGKKQSLINRSEGRKIEMINQSEGAKQRKINEAEGKAQEIEAIADATAQSIAVLAEAISNTHGEEAVRLRLSQRYLNQFGSLATNQSQVILPKDISNIKEILASIGLPLNMKGKA